MKKRAYDRECMMAAIIKSADFYDVHEDKVVIWEDTDEAFSVGFDYKDRIACGIELGFQNGVDTAYSASYQDLQFPTDGYEEANTIEEAIDIMEGWIEYGNENE